MKDASWKNLFMWGMYVGIFGVVMSLISLLLGMDTGPELEFARNYFFTMIYVVLFMVAVLGIVLCEVTPEGRKSK